MSVHANIRVHVHAFRSPIFSFVRQHFTLCGLEVTICDKDTSLQCLEYFKMAVISAARLHAIKAQVWQAHLLSVYTARCKFWMEKLVCSSYDGVSQESGHFEEQRALEERRVLHAKSKQMASFWPDALQVALLLVYDSLTMQLFVRSQHTGV